MPLPEPRSYVFEEYTRTVCPECFAGGSRRSDEADLFVDGALVSHGGKVWMRRWCATHGETESLYEEDLALWRARAGWGTPTLPVTPDRPGNFAGFPAGYREGLPASHGQHTCVLLLNVTERCNLSCPTCYASARGPGDPGPMEERPTREEILATLDTAISREGGHVSVVMLSGGEPTLRRDLEALVEAVLSRSVTRILLNTNGRRIARDERLVELLARHRDRIEVYLQFDGLTDAVHRHFRDEALADEKARAIARLDAAGVFFTLVMTVARGVNEDQVGDVLLRGLEVPHCAGLAVQPVFGSGRNSGIDALNRVTPTGVLARLAGQTGGAVQGSDFIPLPCSHRDCCDMAYLLRTPKAGWQSLAKLLGRDELRRWIGLVSNTIAFESASEAVKTLLRSGALGRVFSESQKVGALALARDLAKLCGCVPGLSDLLAIRDARGVEALARATFRVTVKQFMDAHTFHEARIRQCCVHVGTFEEDPRRYSFCWRWLFADASDFPTRHAERPLRVLA